MTLAYHQELANLSGTIQAWEGVIDRKWLDWGKLEGFHLLHTRRLALAISESWVENTCPGFIDACNALMGSTRVVISLLWSEGVNGLRYDQNFINACHESKVSLPAGLIDDKWLREKFPDTWMQHVESLEQVPHKDMVPGCFENIDSYLPLQLIFPLSGDFDIAMWLKRQGRDKMKGKLQLFEDFETYRKEELAAGFTRQLVEVKQGQFVFFHPKLT
jgi:hypothetical protein